MGAVRERTRITSLTCIVAAAPAIGASHAHRVDLAPLRENERDALRLALPHDAIDYGSFFWVEGDLPAIHPPLVTTARIDDAYRLRIAGHAFDPARDEPAWPAGWSPADAHPHPTGSLDLVQLRGPTKAEWLDAIEHSGAELIQHIPPFTYVVWRPHGAEVRDTPGVRAATAFAPACKVAPKERSLDGALVDMQALIVQASGVDATLDAIRALGAEVAGADILDHRFAIATFRAPGALLRDIAHLEGVYAAQTIRTDGGARGEASCQIMASGAVAPNPGPGYNAFLNGLGLDGTGVVIAHVDQGIADAHPALAGALLPCVGDTCAGANMNSLHGTHTAGCIVGAGSVAFAGFIRAQGVAPGASLIDQTWVGNFNQPSGMLTLIEGSHANGALISNNSWGASSTAQGYDIDTMLVDMGVRDADPIEPGDQPVCYVLAIDNGFGGISSIGSPDEAKNVISVGSTFAEVSSGGVSPLADNVSSGSAHGPTLDGRRVPHLVAPGCQVDGAQPTSGYTFLCGTSFSAPHTTGVAALFVERYRALFPGEPDPSPALIKAVLCGSALSLQGMNDADGDPLGPAPDNKQGWGRVSIPGATDVASMALVDQPVVLTQTGQEWATTVVPIDPQQPMRIMLTWTDAPGHGLGGETPAWNNDLDLRVNVAGQLYLGNNFDAAGVSITGGAPDFMNNNEGVVLDPPPGAGATITVRAADLNSDGVPGVPGNTDQDFAIACLNCAFEPGFTLMPTPASIDICAGDAGAIVVQTQSVLGFPDPITLDVVGLPDGMSATITPNPVTPGDPALIDLLGSANATPGLYDLSLTGDAGDATQTVPIPLRVDAQPPPAPTLASPPDTQPAVSFKPTFAWQALGQASSYLFELAIDPDFMAPVESIATAATTLKVTSPLTLGQTYWWRITPINACGAGTPSQAFSFTVNATPRILLVDDDDNSPNVRPFYEPVFDEIGELFDVWSTNNSDNEPSFAQLAQYDAVVWFTGDEFGGFAGPGPAGEAALAQFLDAGGCLLLSSQDYLNDRGITTLMTQRFGLATANEDVTQFEVTGANLFEDFGTIELQYTFSNFSDRIVPTDPAGVMFVGEDGDAGIGVITDDSAAIWFAFPLEAVGSLATRSAIVQRIVDLCAPEPPIVCVGDLTGDLVVNSSDLNLLLAGFGAGDLGDLDGDGDTDSTDLNILLAAFGDVCE